jgi:hypothetical protein
MKLQEFAQCLFLFSIRFVGIDFALRLEDGKPAIGVGNGCWRRTTRWAHGASAVRNVASASRFLAFVARAPRVDGHDRMGLGGGGGRRSPRGVLRCIAHGKRVPMVCSVCLLADTLVAYPVPIARGRGYK